MILPRWLLPLVLLGACSGGRGGADKGRGGEDDTASPAAPAVTGARHVARLSLDLRGTRPSAEELAAGVDDAFLDGLLSDPRFAARMRWVWNDALQTAVWGASYTRFGTLSFAEWRALGAEPLDLIEQVIAADRPLSDMVTAQTLPLSATLVDLYGLPPDSHGTDTDYGDGRPMAGVLSTNALWLRYTADEVNHNRTRANTVARVFLCSDFLDREGGFRFEVDPSALSAIEAAVSSEPACLSCHAALDPLARFFGGFAPRSDNHPLEQYVHYSGHQHQRLLAEEGPPAYYGHPAADLADLGALIAADPRFWRCATRRLYTGLTRQAPTPAEEDRLTALLLASGGSARALVREIVQTDAYLDPAWRLLRPEQLTTSIPDALGWTHGDALEDGLNDLTWDPELRVLAGGTDDNTITTPNSRPGVGLLVAATGAARRAAAAVAPEDLGDEAEARQILADWHTRLLSAPIDPDDPALDPLLDLADSHGPAAALEALLRHPQGLLY